MRKSFGCILVLFAVIALAIAGTAMGANPKAPAPLVVHLNVPNSLVRDGGLVSVTGYVVNTTKEPIHYLKSYLTQAADDGSLDVLKQAALARVTRAMGFQLTGSTGLGTDLAVSLVKPGKLAFTVWVRIPDRAKSEPFALANFICLQMTVQQLVPGKPYAGLLKDSNAVCGQYVAGKK